MDVTIKISEIIIFIGIFMFFALLYYAVKENNRRD